MFNNFNNLDNTQNHWLDDLLAAQADALIADEDEFQRGDLTSDQALQANGLLELAVRVNESLQPVMPSEAFMARLKDELVGEAQPTLLVRWRKLPPQYQLAAKLGGLTITAGIMLLAARTGINAIGALQHRNQPDQSQTSHSTLRRNQEPDFSGILIPGPSATKGFLHIGLDAV